MNFDTKIADKVLTLTIEGNIDESMISLDEIKDDLDNIDKVVIDCKKIEYINSIGIMNWISFFQPIRDMNKELVFRNCSPAVVRQGGMMMNSFLLAEEVECLAIPYVHVCSDGIEVQSNTYVSLKDLEDMGYEVEDQTCDKCGNPMQFDEMEELYFQLFKE